MAAMPAEATKLLLRTSLAEGGFDRALALALAELTPPVPFPGLVLDHLIGPWIEPLPRDRLRISPLLEGAANEVLSEPECRPIHHCIAERLIAGESLSVLDADPLLRHALGSGDGGLAAAFASSIVTCGEETLEMLAPFTGALQRLDCTRPVLSEDPAASSMLRLAQLLVLLPQGSPGAVRQCWDALERERVHVAGQELFESAVLAKLLMNSRAGFLFPEWPDLLLRLDTLARTNESLATAHREYSTLPGGPPDLAGVILGSQLQSIQTVSSFRALMVRLDHEAPDFRERCLSAFRPGLSDVSILINHGWLEESRKPDFDWASAAEDYAACAEIAFSWGNRGLAVRCAIAQAICIDENGDDRDRALSCLSDAEHRFGFDVALGRARAKIHWRRRDHASALPLLTAAADAGGQDPLERLYIAREAGISAGELGDWSSAERWFAHQAAVVLSQPAVRATAIGLLADMGHAACRAGEPVRALQKLREAALLLPTIDPDGTLAEAYCHRIVRHGVLWFLRTVKGVADPKDRDVGYVPGCGSNVDPNEEIRKHPIASADYLFYLLATSDLALPDPSGYFEAFRPDLTGGPILSFEVLLSIQLIRKAIRRHETDGFIQRVQLHAATWSLIQAVEGLDRPDLELNPRRGSVPLTVIGTSAPSEVRSAGEDFVLTFSIVAALAGNFHAVDAAARAGLEAPELAALRPIFERILGSNTNISSDREGAAVAVDVLRTDLSGRPAQFLWCGIWLLLHLRTTALREHLLDAVLAWLFDGWTRLVQGGRFLLSAPNITLRAVEEVLAQPERTLAAAARLVLAATPASGTTISSTIRSLLQQMAGEESHNESSGGDAQTSP